MRVSKTTQSSIAPATLANSIRTVKLKGKYSREETTRRKKAIVVAQDILASLRIRGGLTPRTGNYLDYNRWEENAPDARDKFFSPKTSVKARAEAAKKFCDVCALGACFLSTVAKFNNFDMWDGSASFPDHLDMRARLAEVFTPDQQAMIECAFERSTTFTDYADSLDPESPEIIAAVVFGRKYQTEDYHDDRAYSNAHRARLRAIMKNIIANDGVFNPPPVAAEAPVAA